MKPDAALTDAPERVALESAPSKLSDLMILAKVRLNSLVVTTAAGGYYMASTHGVDPFGLVNACLGTALVAGGAAAINQVDERDLDRLMRRTRSRPVPAGRVSVSEARAFGLSLVGLGLVLLWLGANGTAALVALATFVIYAGVYTPLKRRTSLATVVGAVPGALPPLIGWTAAGGSLVQAAPWTLFLVLFLWQLPHFLAIAWLCREDYARAGLPMLPVIDPGGEMTGRQAALYAATLVLFSLLPAAIGLSGTPYGVGAVVLGAALVVLAGRFAWRRTDANARLLFYGSITYLPLLLLLMVAARP